MEEALTKAGVCVTTLTTDDDGPNRRLDMRKLPPSSGFKRVYVRKWTEFYKVAPGAIPWLWANVRSFDVVHIHALFSFTSTCAALVARLRGVPYVVRPLGTLNKFGVTQRRPILKSISLAFVEVPIVRRAAAVHFTALSEMNESMTAVPVSRSCVVPIGVPSKIGRPRVMSPDGADILYLGRLDPVKNLEALLRGFAKLLLRHPSARLTIAGSGAANYVATLQALATKLELGRNVVWAGHVEGEQKDQYLSRDSIFVLASHSENFGIAAVEAMAAGLPCVLSRGVAVAEAAASVGAAICIEPTPEAITIAVEALIYDRDRREALSKCAIAYAREVFSPEAMAANLCALYADIAGKGRRHHPTPSVVLPKF